MAVSRPENRFETSNEHTISTYGISKKIDQKRKSVDTTYLTHADVQRNSLAESGMRVLRRLEVGHDGLRTPKGRENCLRIYQAVKYLGWSVHNPPTILISVPRETLE